MRWGFDNLLLIGEGASSPLWLALPAIVAMVLFITVAGDQVLPTIHWLTFPGVLALMFVFNLGLSFLVAALTAHLPDLKFIWQLASTFWFMLSGVFFPQSQLPDAVLGVANQLPLAHAVALVRPLLLGQMPQQIGFHLAVLALITVLAFWLALALTRRRLLN